MYTTKTIFAQRCLTRAAAAWLAMPLAAISPAAILVDQSPSTGPYGGAWVNRDHTQIFADSFTFTQGANITGYDYYSTSGTFGGTSWLLNLYTDSGSNTPGSVLRSLSVSPSSTTFIGLFGVNQWVSTFDFSAISVSANTEYWIGIAAEGFEGAASSVQPSSNGDDFLAQRQFDGVWERTNQVGDMTYRLRGTPVPEPASLAVLVLGSLGVLGRRRARK